MKNVAAAYLGLKRNCAWKMKTMTLDHSEITKLREQVAAQAADIEWMRGVMECHAIDLRERDAAIKFHAEKARSQAAVIESLKRAIGDWDRAETPSELQSAESGLLKALSIPTNSTQILADVRRAEREKCAERAEAYAYMSQNFNALAEEIRAMEDE